MKNIILLLVALSLTGCVSLYGYKEKIQTPKNNFVAKYYDGGNFIASETVDRISIHYIYDSFHGIISQSFNAVWEGEINGGTDGKNITMSFDSSHSSRSVYVDNKKMTTWSTSNKHTTEFIEPGIHKLRINFSNGWHTTNFTASFDNYPTVNETGLKNIFMVGIDPHTKVAYIGAYESDDIYNRATISIPKLKAPLVIFLFSHNGINWIIDNPYKTNVSHIVISDRGGSSIMNKQENTKIYSLTNFRGSYKNNSSTVSQIGEITGLAVSYTYGKYELSNVKIPETL